MTHITDTLALAAMDFDYEEDAVWYEGFDDYDPSDDYCNTFAEHDFSTDYIHDSSRINPPESYYVCRKCGIQFDEDTYADLQADYEREMELEAMEADLEEQEPLAEREERQEIAALHPLIFGIRHIQNSLGL